MVRLNSGAHRAHARHIGLVSGEYRVKQKKSKCAALASRGNGDIGQ